MHYPQSCWQWPLALGLGCLVAASAAAQVPAGPPRANPFAPAGMSSVAPPPPAVNPLAGAPLGGTRLTPDAPPPTTPLPATNPAAATPAPRPAATSEPVATRSYRFTIPFTLTPPRDPSETPIEVQLHFSTDRGASWKVFARQHPSQPQFDFSAGVDGEYWFVSRTIDRAGKARPPSLTRPELRVIVDTKPPRLNLATSIGPSGEVVANWDVSDENLAPDSVRISYQSNPREPWQNVAVEPLKGEPRTTYQGHTAWFPPAGSDAITVRLEVTDRAGNPGVVHRQVVLGRTAGAPAPPRWAGYPGAPPAAPGAIANPGAFLPPGAGRTNPNGLSSMPAPINPAIASQATPPPPNEPPASLPAASLPTTPAPTAAPSAPPAAPLPSSPESRPPDAPAAGAFPGVPAGERPRMTTSRRFHLHYDVETVGPQGIAKVELWGTRDGGRSWENWGIDPDRTTPFLVEVDKEGLYGFRVVIAGNNGLVSAEPRAGDTADVWIVVDSTRPVGRITSAPYGTGEKAGCLEIHWEAADQWLAERPITLKFGESPNGPWTTLAAGLPNSGQYDWRVDARVPPVIFLRLEVRDEGGNVGEHNLTEPINTRALLPKARIRDLEPLQGGNGMGAYRVRTLR